MIFLSYLDNRKLLSQFMRQIGMADLGKSAGGDSTFPQASTPTDVSYKGPSSGNHGLFFEI